MRDEKKISETRVAQSESDTLYELVKHCPRELIGDFLESFRPYLLAIANAEPPPDLHAEVGASDVVQKTPFQGIREIGTVRARSRQELSQWLRRILLRYVQGQRKLFWTVKRDLANEQLVDFENLTKRECSASAETEAKEEQQRLSIALAILPETYRRAIELRQLKDLSFAEIGARLRLSEEAARKLWVRAIQQLQRELGIDAIR